MAGLGMNFNGRASGLQTTCPALVSHSRQVMNQEFKPFDRPGVGPGPAVAGTIFSGDFDLMEGFEHLPYICVIV
jgi:hypothetical protein